jgi:hypothetical protein
MTPEEVRTGISIGGVLGAILGSFGITRFMLRKTGQDVDKLSADLEKLRDKDFMPRDQFMRSCAEQRENCPVCIRLAADSVALDDIKKGQTDLIIEMRKEFKEHRELHLTMAEGMGAMRADINHLKKSRKS